MLYREPALKDEHKAQFEAELAEKARLETERAAAELKAVEVHALEDIEKLKPKVGKKVKKPRKK